MASSTNILTDRLDDCLVCQHSLHWIDAPRKTRACFAPHYWVLCPLHSKWAYWAGTKAEYSRCACYLDDTDLKNTWVRLEWWQRDGQGRLGCVGAEVLPRRLLPALAAHRTTHLTRTLPASPQDPTILDSPEAYQKSIYASVCKNITWDDVIEDV
jgi:hypothetical protein